MRSRDRTIGVALAVLVLAGAGGLVLDGSLRRAEREAGRRYAPGSQTARPTSRPWLVPGMLSAQDFDGGAEGLYVLDPRAPAVHLLVPAGDTMRLERSFGRRGGGPGEFVQPTGLAVLRDRPQVVVAEPARLHFFTLTGEYVESTALDLPCAMPLPRVAAAARGLFVHGGCLRHGVAGDSMMAVLLWSPDGREFREIARDLRFTLDGRHGHAFAAEVALAEGDGTRHLFGSGATPCLYIIEEGTGAPTARRRCDADLPRHRLQISAASRRELEAARRGNPLLAASLQLPSAHAPYSVLLSVAEEAVLLREYSEDSSVLRRFGSRRDLAVLGQRELRGCRRPGCLYATPEADGTRLRLLAAARLRSLLTAVP